MNNIITAKLGTEIINCYDGKHNKETLKSWASKNILICPACDKPYEYCHGEFKLPYFRHKEKDKCEDIYSEPETEEHIQGKQDLYEWIKVQKGVTNVVLEGWIPETHQRPDIMFKYNGEQFVIEYQCSPIASEYKQRHELYQAAGIKDIWILGTKKYFNYINQDESNNRRKRVIEKYTGYYYDSFNKIIMFEGFKGISKRDGIKIPSIPIFTYSYYKDFIKDYEKIELGIVTDKYDLLCVSIDKIDFSNRVIKLKDNFMEYIENKYNTLIANAENELNKIIMEVQNCNSNFRFKISKNNGFNWTLRMEYKKDSAMTDTTSLYFDYLDEKWKEKKLAMSFVQIDKLSNYIQNKIQDIINYTNKLSEFNKINKKLNDYYKKYGIIFDFDEKSSNYYDFKFVIDSNYYFFIKNNNVDFCTTTKCYYYNHWHTKWKTVESFEYENIEDLYTIISTIVNKEFASQIAIKDTIENNKLEKIKKYNSILYKYLNKEIILINAVKERRDFSFRYKYLKGFSVTDEYMENQFIKELDFLNRKNVGKFIFMIPRYDSYFHSLGFNSYVRVGCLNNKILEYFKSFGFTNVRYYDYKEEL